MPAASLAPFGLVDLFCGCGGLSLGFSLTRRFEALLGCDIKEEATTAFADSHTALGGKRPVVVNEDIQKLDPAEVAERVDRAAGGKRTLCLVGGPPCEGFSQNRSLGSGGDWRENKAKRVDKFVEDPRNQLFKWYLRIAEQLKPSVLLIENVPDLVRHNEGDTLREILAELDTLGYRAEARILNAADYGVPQLRRRTFILAQRWKDVRDTGLRLELPRPSHANFPYAIPNECDDPHWLPGDSGYWVTVREAIGDLPAACADDEYKWPGYRKGAEVTAFRRWVRGVGVEPVTHHVGRTLGESSLQRVNSLAMGQRAADMPDEIRPKSSFHYSYSRLRWGEPARTITKFAYNVGSGMFAHPTEPRCMTMREAARLQSFPDWVAFPTTRIREISALIGSAVPPLLAWHIGISVAKYLDQLARHRAEEHGGRAGVGVATDAVVRRLEGTTWTNDPAELGDRGLEVGGAAAPARRASAPKQRKVKPNGAQAKLWGTDHVPAP